MGKKNCHCEIYKANQNLCHSADLHSAEANNPVNCLPRGGEVPGCEDIEPTKPEAYRRNYPSKKQIQDEPVSKSHAESDFTVDIDKIVETLIKAEQQRSDFVNFMENYKDPYIVLIACILSLRTNDKTTYPATKRMLEIGKTPEDFAKCDVKKLEKAIYPVGFYANKAKQIVELSKEIVEKYNGKTPDSIEELVKFNGVGRKTANLVLAKGFNKPAICVDVHVHRIFNRLGYVKTKTPEETEFALREKLPEKYWIDINTLIVTHGQNICKPQRPLCDKCPIEKYCNKILN